MRLSAVLAMEPNNRRKTLKNKAGRDVIAARTPSGFIFTHRRRRRIAAIPAIPASAAAPGVGTSVPGTLSDPPLAKPLNRTSGAGDEPATMNELALRLPASAAVIVQVNVPV